MSCPILPTLVLGFLGLANLLAAAPLFKDAQLTVDLLAEPQPIQPGKPFTVGLRFRPEPGWHIYWKNPGDSGMPPTVQWKLPEGYTAGPLQFPLPEKILAPPLVTYGYEMETLLLAEIIPPAGQPLPAKIKIGATLDWLVCKEICLPGRANLDLNLSSQPKDNIDLQGLLDEIRREMPARIPGVSVEGQVSGGFLILRILGAAGPGNLSFFPDQGGYIDEFTPAQNQRSGQNSILRIPLKEKATVPGTVSGLLVAENPWDSSGHRALEFSFPLQAPEIPPNLGGGGSSSRLPLIFLFAFLGGLILNVMPCVLPVLSLKALHLVQLSAESRASARTEGFAYTAGVLLSLLALAGCLIVLRASGQALGWGFQLQSPPVVWLLLALLFALSLNLLGLFEFNVLLGNLSGQGPRQGWSGSFFSGLLAVAVASPCTAPFMGVALAAAFALPAVGTLAVFTALALGFALPILLLSFFPNALAVLPKPGAWMNHFKKILALPMLLAVGWLAWVLFRLSGPAALLPLLLGGAVLALGLFLYGRSQRTFPPPAGLHVGGLALVLLAAVLPATTLKTASTDPVSRHPDRLPWSEEEVARQLAAGRTVFIDFTAAWCLTCQVNERVVLSQPEIQAAFREKNVTFLVADWTRRDPAITSALRKYRREGVPTYVILRPDGSAPVLLPEILTPSIVLQALP
jgi:thiol:disulfide interchange protein DsbD